MLARPALAFALLAALAAPAWSADNDVSHTVSVSGEGEARVVPDTAQVSAGVVTQAGSAAVALKENSAQMDKVIKAIQSYGIASGDVQTQGVNISPVMGRPGGRGEAPQITGYRASNIVSIQVRDMAKLGGVLDGLVSAGANEMHGIRLTVAKPDKLLDDARVEAMADAKRKAELLAKAAGAKVGRVISISEGFAGIPRPPILARAAMAADAVPVAAGEVELKATVRVVYALE